MSDKLPRQPRDKESGLPKKYVRGLSKADKAKQVKSIKEGKDRPKLKSAPPSKRSSHVEKFEKKYGYKITNDSRISKEIISKTGIDKILSKGRGAYYSGGSRPNTTPSQWARARLASVIMGGKARQVDKAIWEKYKK
jgi:hypothetical protein|tara:strand:+ start:522 stop:932 length:411 start_codon:yes stop_codon:yes gene_type:complete